MNRAHRFAINSKNAMFCSLCDYDFHKMLIEDKKIKFSYEFCTSMINETFDYTSVFHLQLVDYFNNLIQTLQCDSETGEKKSETSVFFEEDKAKLNMIIDCDQNNREHCFDYCESFYFTVFSSVFDVDFEKIGKMYEFVYDKVMSFKLKTTEPFNVEFVNYFYQDIVMEKSN